MQEDNFLRDFSALPPEAQRQVTDFIAFLQTRYQPRRNRVKKTKVLSSEAFIGLWRDREDMRDSAHWVRETRQREWGK
jgi:hypothetical protein